MNFSDLLLSDLQDKKNRVESKISALRTVVEQQLNFKKSAAASQANDLIFKLNNQLNEINAEIATR